MSPISMTDGPLGSPPSTEHGRYQAGMAPLSPVALSAAHRLLSRGRAAAVAQEASHGPLAVAEMVGRQLATTLSRWFGPYGYHALLTRALADALRSHPALGAVRVKSPTDPAIVGLADASAAHGIDATMEGVTTLLATMVDLLGRLIGEDLAMNLMEQAVPDVTGRDAKANLEEHLS
jgi:hypothetical protein